MAKVQKRGLILVLAGLLLVAVALGMHLMQKKQDALAGQTAQMLLQQLELNRLVIHQESNESPVDETPAVMPEKEYMDYRMLGSVQVSSVGVKLPVLSSWDEQMLKIAPCRYSGSIPEQNMIIMGHNYKSHFTPLHQVNVGDEVIFEDVAGIIYRYRVATIETLHRSQGELLPSDYPLTLFTCTPGGINRLVIRCETAGKQ